MSEVKFQTLYCDTEKSGADYVDDYAGLPGVQGPLWCGRKIPVLGVCGEIAQGKTTFLLDIAKGPVKYLDLRDLMLKHFPQGYKPVDLYLFWHRLMKQVPPGMFRVIALDVAEEIEIGLGDWVWDNPLEFGHTKAQYLKMGGIYQNDVSNLWKTIIADLASRCETFAFANHMKEKWTKDGETTGARLPKGRPALKQLAALYLKLTREKDAAGNVAARPSGTVDQAEGGKARLRVNLGGEWVPILPPRMPIATPEAIRQYILNPPNYANLKPEERAPDHVITDQERTELRIRAANAESEAERLRIERLHMERTRGSEPPVRQEPAPAVGQQEASPENRMVSPPLPAVGNGQIKDEPTRDGAVKTELSATPAPASQPSPPAPAVQEPQPTAVAEQLSRDMGPAKYVDLREPQASRAELAAPATPATNGPVEKKPQPKDAITYVAQIRELWAEVAFHLKLDPVTQDKILAAQLAKYKVTEINDLGPGSLEQFHGALVARLRKVYADMGKKDQCPF